MSAPPRWIQDIENQARGLPVLLVEGQADVAIFEYIE